MMGFFIFILGLAVGILFVSLKNLKIKKNYINNNTVNNILSKTKDSSNNSGIVIKTTKAKYYTGISYKIFSDELLQQLVYFKFQKFHNKFQVVDDPIYSIKYYLNKKIITINDVTKFFTEYYFPFSDAFSLIKNDKLSVFLKKIKKYCFKNGNETDDGSYFCLVRINTNYLFVNLDFIKGYFNNFVPSTLKPNEIKILKTSSTKDFYKTYVLTTYFNCSLIGSTVSCPKKLFFKFPKLCVFSGLLNHLFDQLSIDYRCSNITSYSYSTNKDMFMLYRGDYFDYQYLIGELLGVNDILNGGRLQSIFHGRGTVKYIFIN